MTPREGAPIVKRRAAAGFTLLEILIVLAIGLVITAIAVPMTNNAMRSYRLMAAVSASTGAIQSTRYTAIMHGYPYELTFTPPNTYQVLTMIPPATTYSAVVNLGGILTPTPSIPITSAGEMAISRTVTYQFAPGGTVTETSNNMSFQIAYINPETGLPYTTAGSSNTIKVSGVGNVTVSSP